MNTYILEIKQILAEARQKAYTVINSAMVEAYWNVGERIVYQEQGGKNRAAYGEQVLKELSIALTSEFGKGFSYANLRNFRQFYLTYPDFEKCYTLCSKLTWSHNRLIMRIDNPQARDFYLKETAENNWSVRLLERNINTFYFQRILSSQEKTLLPVKASEQMQVSDFIKDPYVFEFLNIEQPHTANEHQIETALIDKLEHFLLELGKGFSFVGRQYRISSELEHYYIDLVF
jgi:predicted nuclease of restriction endonuclease-like (RecB) superfamily